MEASNTIKSELIETILTKLGTVIEETNAGVGCLGSEVAVSFQQYTVSFVEFLVEREATRLDLVGTKEDGLMDSFIGYILTKHLRCLEIIEAN